MAMRFRLSPAFDQTIDLDKMFIHRYLPDPDGVDGEVLLTFPKVGEGTIR